VPVWHTPAWSQHPAQVEASQSALLLPQAHNITPKHTALLTQNRIMRRRQNRRLHFCATFELVFQRAPIAEE
jgi:hypothetical protein